MKKAQEIIEKAESDQVIITEITEIQLQRSIDKIVLSINKQFLDRIKECEKTPNSSEFIALVESFSAYHSRCYYP